MPQKAFGSEFPKEPLHVALRRVRVVRDAVTEEHSILVWHATIRMRYRAELSHEQDAMTDYELYADGMWELDGDMGVPV